MEFIRIPNDLYGLEGGLYTQVVHATVATAIGQFLVVVAVQVDKLVITAKAFIAFLA